METAAARPSFKYVYIPAELWGVGRSEPLQELELQIPEGKDVEILLDTLKKHFAETGPQKTDHQRAAQRKALLDNLGKNSEGMNLDLLDVATNMQMVENVALLTNSPATGYVGVNLYCDDEGSIKELPVNLRASDIANCCGKSLQIRGDAFMARVFDNDDDFERRDFLLSEVSSSAAWVRQAHDLNTRSLLDRPRTEQFLNKLQQQRQGNVTISPAEAAKEQGNEAFKKGLWDEAVHHYSNAIKCNHTLTAAYNNRALALLKLGKLDECIADCDHVLEAEPQNVKALLRRAAAKEQLMQPPAALHDFQRALELQPSNKEAQEGVLRMSQPVGQIAV